MEGLIRVFFVVLLVGFATASAFAFAPVPVESAKALKVTRGKPFHAGAVFINGKYIDPPYVVERWGTGIRINGHPVTGQVVAWNEFVKTQPVVATNSIKGEFILNDAAKAKLARINVLRTEIDRTIRTGGFICFGDSYSQVTGDARTLRHLLERLPDFQKNARDEQDFCLRVRAAGFLYLHEVLSMDLYRNRIDYRKLQERCAKLKRDSEIRKMLDDASTPLL